MAVGGIHKITPPRKAGGIPWVSTRFGLRVENERADADGTASTLPHRNFKHKNTYARKH